MYFVQLLYEVNLIILRTESNYLLEQNKTKWF